MFLEISNPKKYLKSLKERLKNLLVLPRKKNTQRYNGRYYGKHGKSYNKKKNIRRYNGYYSGRLIL